MRKTNFIIGIGIGMAVVTATTTLADSHGIDIAEARERASHAFDHADANGDGLVSAEEFAGAERPRRGMRGPERGRRGPGPGPRMHGGPGFMDGGIPERRRQAESETFAVLDQDGDGSVSEDEYAARHESMKNHRQARIFTRLDANDSGYLEADEFPPEVGRLEKLDADNDGIVSREEMRAGAELQRELRREHLQEELKSS